MKLSVGNGKARWDLRQIAVTASHVLRVDILEKFRNAYASRLSGYTVISFISLLTARPAGHPRMAVHIFAR